MPRKVAAQQLSLELHSLQFPALDDRRESRSEGHRDSPERYLKPKPSQVVTAPDQHLHDAVKRRPPSTELLGVPGALLTRSDLRELGLERRAIDAIFRTLPVVALPGYARPMIRADEYNALIDASTYRDDRVRPRHA